MDAFVTSALLVAIAEIGDKTQLLALVLAARFQRPLAITLGILVATLANHFLAALVGQQAAAFLDTPWFSLLVGLAFLAMAGWALIPDQLEDSEGQTTSRYGPFVTTLVAFFLVEMGDKTQIATVALGAQFQSALAVTAGTTLGMMMANVPVVLLGQALIRRIPLRTIRIVAATLFAGLGLWIIATSSGGLT